jgi:hypothetical protein
MDTAPLVAWTLRKAWLKACCGCAEQRGNFNFDVRTTSCAVAAALSDAERRVAVMGGREGLPRSLGSVYAGSITRFLGGSFKNVLQRTLTVRKPPSKQLSFMAMDVGRNVRVEALRGFSVPVYVTRQSNAQNT